MTRSRCKTWAAWLLLAAGVGGCVSCAFMYRSPDETPRVARPVPRWMFMATSFSGAEVVPPAPGKGGGTLRSTLEIDTGILSWEVFYARLSGPPTLAGFYGPAAPGSTGPLAFALMGSAHVHESDAPGSGQMRGRIHLTPAQVADLLGERWYLGIATAAHPGGEVRGQVAESHAGVGGV